MKKNEPMASPRNACIYIWFNEYYWRPLYTRHTTRHGMAVQKEVCGHASLVGAKNKVEGVVHRL